MAMSRLRAASFCSLVLSRSLRRRSASRTISLAELYIPLATFSLTRRSSSGVRDTFIALLLVFGLARVTGFVNVRYQISFSLTGVRDEYHYGSDPPTRRESPMLRRLI